MTPETKKKLIETELEVLAVLRERLQLAITLFDAEDDDITKVNDFDKAKALASENREVLTLIKNHQEYLSDALKSPIDQD